MPHFYSSDLLGAAISSLLAIPLILLPGYGLGWWLDLLGFRALPPPTRWSLAPGLGLTMAPILVYLPFRLVSASAAWTVAAVLCVTGLMATLKQSASPTWNAIPRSAKIAVLTWLVLCTGLMLDIAIGNRLYPSSIIVDTSFRSEVISSIAHSEKLPAISPFYFPGHTTILRYHYVYFVIPAFMVQAGHGLVAPAMALVSLTIWTGLAFLGVLSAFIRFFWKMENPERGRNIAWALLLVGGLDLLFAGTQMIQRRISGEFVFTGLDVGLWNGWGSAFGWLSTVLLCPHHLGGLMAGILACILLWHSRDETGWRRWASAVAAGMMLATLGGTSLYVGAMFAIFLCIVVLEVLLNAPRRLAPLLAAGGTAVLMILPFFLDVRLPSSASTPAFFQFQVRGFLPITLLFPALGIKSPYAWNLAYFISLPLTYLCEFGFFFVAGLWWLWQSRKRPPEDRYRYHMVLGLMATSILIPSIAWSGMEISNDLGFRGTLPAQFLLLFCAAEFLSGSAAQLDSMRRVFRVAIVLIVIGAGGTLLEMVVLRRAIGTTAQQTIQAGEMFRADTSAERLADLRQAYTWIHKNTPKNAVVQENPITWQMVAQGQYSERRTVVYGMNPNYLVGEDHSEFGRTASELAALYAPGTLWHAVVANCSRFNLNYLVTQTGDASWNDHASYVWSQQPVFANSEVRVFHCGLGTEH